MIDRVDIYDYLESQVNLNSRPVAMSSRFEPTPEEFPFCFANEISRSDVRQNVTLNVDQNVKNIGWEVQVFSNKEVGAVEEAFDIMSDVEVAMQEMKFIETYCHETPWTDRSIYRVVARFERVIADSDSLPTQGV